MEELTEYLCREVSEERLRDLTLELVEIPSPTGDSVAVTECYADHVRSLGVPLEVVRDYPSSPSTIARYSGRSARRTLTLDGHLDTIHAEHAGPHVAQGRIYGRGAGDMKSGIAAMLEALRLIVKSGTKLDGNLILATHSLHEAPVGNMEGLRALIARGDVFLDAALVAEGGFDGLFIRGKGQALYEISITREGEIMHENAASPLHKSNPLHHAARICGNILCRHSELAQAGDTLLGPETYFIGQIHGGDFYNRVPTRAFVNGTYRYWPDKTWDDVEHELKALLDRSAKPKDLDVEMHLQSNGLGYEVDEQAEIVRALQSGYQRVTGKKLALQGAQSVCDVNVIVREAGIPAVSHGTGSTTAHADVEWVAVDDIVRTTRVFIATILGYLGVAH